MGLAVLFCWLCSLQEWDFLQTPASTGSQWVPGILHHLREGATLHLKPAPAAAHRQAFLSSIPSFSISLCK